MEITCIKGNDWRFCKCLEHSDSIYDLINFHKKYQLPIE